MEKRRKRAREQTKKRLLTAIVCCVLLIFTSCTADALTVNDYFFPYSDLEVFEGFFAQVTFTSSEMVYPETYTENGQTYIVAVINGFENPEDALALTGTLEIRDGIMAINSNAFSSADNVTEVILPVTCRSLGTESLPQNAVSMTMPLRAAADLYRAISDENKEKLQSLTVVGSELVTISGNFCNLESITVQGVDEDSKLYWPNLPTLEKEGLYFGGWVDSDGNTIYGGTKITSATSVATPVWSTEPIDPPPTPDPDTPTTVGGMGFVIPYLGLATEKKYELKYTDNEDGTYSFKPSTTSVEYSIEFDNEEFTDALDEETGVWTVSVTRLGSHIFSVYYLDETGAAVGYGQVTWTATETV